MGTLPFDCVDSINVILFTHITPYTHLLYIAIHKLSIINCKVKIKLTIRQFSHHKTEKAASSGTDNRTEGNRQKWSHMIIAIRLIAMLYYFSFLK